MRDWSQEGAPERTQSYGRICQEAQKQLAGRDADNPPRVLVPGTAKFGVYSKTLDPSPLTPRTRPRPLPPFTSPKQSLDQP